MTHRKGGKFMAINQPVPRSLIEKRQQEQAIKAHPEFQYASHPGDGGTRYVFKNKVCLGYKEAYAYVLELQLQEL